MKIKNLCSAKYTAKRMRRQSVAWETIFIKDIPDKKGLLSKTYKDHLTLNIRKTNNNPI